MKGPAETCKVLLVSADGPTSIIMKWPHVRDNKYEMGGICRLVHRDVMLGYIPGCGKRTPPPATPLPIILCFTLVISII